MQLAVHLPLKEWDGQVPDLRDLGDGHVPPSCREAFRAALRRVARALDGVGVGRLCFGSEFCARLLPGAAQLEQALARAEQAGLGISLLTPPCSDEDLKRVQPLLTVLASHAGRDAEAEVVFNDWGVAHLAARVCQDVSLVRGRLLFKAVRDPRFTRLLVAPGAGSGTPLEALRSAGQAGGATRTLLERLGVSRVEQDVLPQGSRFASCGPRISLYLPFGVVATTRQCPAAGRGLPPERKFTPGGPCARECSDHIMLHRYDRSPLGLPAEDLLVCGTACLFHQQPAEIDAALAALKEGSVDRLVVQAGTGVWS